MPGAAILLTVFAVLSFGVAESVEQGPMDRALRSKRPAVTVVARDTKSAPFASGTMARSAAEAIALATVPAGNSELLARSQSPEEPDPQTPAAPRKAERRLAPRVNASPVNPTSQPTTPATRTTQLLRAFGTQSVVTTVAGLSVVLGVLLLTMLLLRRNLPAAMRPLPAEVARVLGRVNLAGKQQAQLLHVGNKLVLVAAGNTAATPLAEVTDPAEVDRVLALCAQKSPGGATAEFEELFRNMGREPAQGFLWREAEPTSRKLVQNAYQQSRGGTRRG